MRIVFMGTPAFSVPALRSVASRHDVLAVVTRPDAVSKRGSAPSPSPVKTAAGELDIPVIEASSLRQPDTVDAIRALGPDAICVVAYGAILPREVLDIPQYGCINAHASLLPRHRGAAPIERAILEGDEVTGVSIMRMEEGLDTGPVCLRVAVEVASADAATLASRLSLVAADALVATLDDVAHGRARWEAQDASRATYAHKITRDDVRLTPDLDVASALRRVRASSERATVRVRLADGVDVVIAAAEASDERIGPGRARLTRSRLILGFRDGTLQVTRLRPTGRREMSAAEFACGTRIPESFTWSPL
ncbi:MAG: methionyl-tRNA formyltransferase [Anaerosomatales bacterium]|nr:methionyl-tRNA formyltransferase [Coriobacteriia bacterium]MDI6692956.1 methionyl-tRNA formyltransferase [Anaerosomatales bacterium]